MYLKALELVGFKSFADKTKLDFEPGMTAIVGPNGCGKSNISDAIRWVIGEQSAKALRGSKMEDCIFNGTDSRKPHGMAEVSITFADCEGSLGTEYNEMTVTRRVFRSGEGQYFINKTPCRLKDIQRLFMDTGVGTVSYSLMEQGRIDRVLSSHPEDRRVIFEEASGITKYKADKSEALRKLEHTEANLLRLTDVIREVKRQIGSLQRQAGKARTYKALRDELRQLDIFTTREHLTTLDTSINTIEARIVELSGSLSTTQAEVEQLEKETSAMRDALMQTERDIGAAQEAGAQAQNRLDHSRELIETNRQRITEYKLWAERDTGEIQANRKQLEDKRHALAELTIQTDRVRGEQTKAEARYQSANERFLDHQKQIDSARTRIQALREESIELDSTYTKLHNQLMEIEARRFSSSRERERLAAEQGQLTRLSTSFEKRQTEMAQALSSLKEALAAHEKNLRDLLDRKARKEATVAELKQDVSDLRAKAATRQAQVDMLSAEEAATQAPVAIRAVMDDTTLGLDKNRFLGELASHLEVNPAYRLALEAALRAWLDAMIVSDTATAIRILKAIESRKAGAIRMVTLEGPEAPPLASSMPGIRLTDHVKCPESVWPAITRLIGNVLIVDSLDQAPRPMPQGAVYVTPTGAVLRDGGCLELWARDSQPANPLSRKHALLEARTCLEDFDRQASECQARIAALVGEVRELESALSHAQAEVSRCNREAAHKEGEAHMVNSEAAQARERLETVSWELGNLTSQEESGDAEKETITRRMNEVKEQREKTTSDIAVQGRELTVLESRFSELQADVTQSRIDITSLTQKLETLTVQNQDVASRITELATAIEGRSAGIQSYQSSIERLAQEVSGAEGQLAALEEAVKTGSSKTEALRQSRDQQAGDLSAREKALSAKRLALDEIRSTKGQQEVKLAESRMRRQNQIDRITSEYALTLEQFQAEPPPTWEGDPQPLEVCETKVAELRTKIDAMGPVNLVAIEEYQELEQRYEFLTTQEQDLINSKQQLMDMIRTINKTTSEMFSKTFAQVNENFQIMFNKMFNGGTAKLVLVNEEDVLECGIEIIARPPGKRLQNVSLLSGGERTLTAVGLLFAIYMIKPSPFCLLDELDAALDESNIGRFVNVLKSFLTQSQFVVITHNRQTIAAADILYGVTMQEKGISSIVSMKFNEYVGSEMESTGSRVSFSKNVAKPEEPPPSNET